MPKLLGFVPQRQPTLSLLGVKLFSARSGCLALVFINNKFLRCLQQRIKKCAENTDLYQFFNLLTCPELLSTVEALLPEHRERLYPPTKKLSMFLAQALKGNLEGNLGSGPELRIDHV